MVSQRSSNTMKTTDPTASARTTKPDRPHTLLQGASPSSQPGGGPSVGLLVLAVALAIGSNAVLRAQTAELQLVPSNATPLMGTFYLIQCSNLPPLPFNPYPQLDVYSVSEAPGRYWVDDRAVDYVALREQRQMESALRRLERQYGLNSPDGPPPIPGDWDPQGGDSNAPPMSSSVSYPDGSLWLSIAQITNGQAPLVIHGTVQDGLYEILSETQLTNGGWASEHGVRGATNQTWTPTTVAVGDRTNSLFFWARYWADCDGYGTPAAWYWQHGLDPLAAGIATQDPDHDGLLNWQEYLWGADPQVSEGFSVWVSSPGGYSGIP